jgi:hypothetical protein
LAAGSESVRSKHLQLKLDRLDEAFVFERAIERGSSGSFQTASPSTATGSIEPP